MRKRGFCQGLLVNHFREHSPDFVADSSQRDSGLVAVAPSQRRRIPGLSIWRVWFSRSCRGMDGQRKRIGLCDEISRGGHPSAGAYLRSFLSVFAADLGGKALGIAQGLEYLHGSDVVHSDIKSVGTNIFLYIIC